MSCRNIKDKDKEDTRIAYLEIRQVLFDASGVGDHVDKVLIGLRHDQVVLDAALQMRSNVILKETTVINREDDIILSDFR